MLAEPVPMKQETVYDSEDSESESDESESSSTTSTAKSNIEPVAESTNGHVDGGDGTDAARQPPVPKATTSSGAKVRSYSFREPQISKQVLIFGYAPAASAQACPYRIYAQRQIECDAAAADACRRVPSMQSDEEEARRIVIWRHMIKSELLDGRSVKYVSTGHVLYPVIHPGDECMFDPVHSLDTLSIGDIVVCEVQFGKICVNHIVNMYMGGYYWNPKAHKHVSRYFFIGTRDGYVDGWAHEHQIYGRLVDVSYQTS